MALVPGSPGIDLEPESVGVGLALGWASSLRTRAASVLGQWVLAWNLGL